ncbi:flagellar hook-length control protein [Williamsia maris]|uniref:Flagellar hook-length control protein n=1 Tax=Williamsia maris TaxID=72806 RepID=A0ABT1HLA1_9NOCA|nr:flagellar hook-length control protein [Williamsia maris]MCP2178679.1 hypothetical protein [Williamsia maris]
MTHPTKRDVVNSAMDLASDVTEGRLDPDELAAEFAAEARDLFGGVLGPGDPLWELQLDVTREVLGVGGIGADELSEWLAVARRRAEAVDNPAT